jgi:ubiquinol-cytochrome c reductase cytochrome b subunit
MFAMVVHLWGKFFMAAWRGKRKATWITGVVSFLVSVGAAFTGYLSQQNFDSQWISTQAKDGINSTGAGAVFNVTNFGQMIMWHIVLLPLCIVAIVAVHVLMVRLRGVVTPFPAKGETPGADVAATAADGAEVPA